MADFTVNAFRRARGRILRRRISDLAARLGRDITILDVGGRAEYWDNVGLDHIAEIRLLNNEASELQRSALTSVFTTELGDARDLSAYPDKSVDLLHSNSVIEHVGTWPDMCAMAAEAMRVGRAGWVQTPAWEFPIEPHYRLPFLHWLASPARRALLVFSPDYGRLGIRERRHHTDRINLLSRGEVRTLFPGCRIHVERVLLLPKSYVAWWSPADAPNLDDTPPETAVRGTR